MGRFGLRISGNVLACTQTQDTSGTRSSRTACRGGGVAPGWPGTTDNRPRYVTHVGQMSVSYNH